MTKKEKKAWLEAIDQLEKYYKGEIELAVCPLCSVSLAHSSVEKSDCYDCLWVKFEGEHCDCYAYLKFGNVATTLRRRRDPAWVEDSLRRLRRWKRLLKFYPVLNIIKHLKGEKR